MWKNKHEQLEAPKLDNKRLAKYVQTQLDWKQYSNKQYNNPHKTHSNKLYTKKNNAFCKTH